MILICEITTILFPRKISSNAVIKLTETKSCIYALVSYSAFVKVMACRLVGAKALPEPLLNIVNSNVRNKFHFTFKQNPNIFIHENAFGNVGNFVAASKVLREWQIFASHNIVWDAVTHPYLRSLLLSLLKSSHPPTNSSLSSVPGITQLGEGNVILCWTEHPEVLKVNEATWRDWMTNNKTVFAKSDLILVVSRH